MSGQEPFPLDPGPDTLEQLLVGWFGPMPGPPSRPRASMVLPAALESGLATLTRWLGLFVQNALLAAAEIDEVDGVGRFLDENQSVCYWGFRLLDAAEADPPVWAGDGHGNTRRVDVCISLFLTKVTIQEIVLSNAWMSTDMDSRSGTPLLVGLRRLDALGPPGWPPEPTIQGWLHAGHDELGLAFMTDGGDVAGAWRARRVAP